MPKANTNTKECRKKDIVAILWKEHALSAAEIATKLKMHVRSVQRFLIELRAEKKVYRRYKLLSTKKTTFYYSVRREQK